MPIYFSIDPKMCKEILHPIADSMLNEITEYGPSCQEVYLEQLANAGLSGPMTAKEQDELEAMLREEIEEEQA